MTQSASRFAYVDGLRGFAALWVLCYHLWNRFYPGLGADSILNPAEGSLDFLSLLTKWTLGFGYSAVTLFFVLSGFCIHLPQARQKNYSVSLPSFAARRFWRLYPAYLASIVLSACALGLPKLLLAIGGKPFDWWTDSHAEEALISAAFLQQLWPEALGFNGVYWTLVYEVQFYCVYPVLLWCIRRVGFAPVGVLLLVSEVTLSYMPSPVPCLFLNKHFEWFLGVLAAEVVVRYGPELPRKIVTLCLVVGLVAGAFATTSPAISPLKDLFFAIGYFGLLLTATRGQGLIYSLSSSTLFASVGVFSYSLYLIHIPIIDTIWVGLDRLVAQRSQYPAAIRWLTLVSLPVSVATAYGFYRVFEKPFLVRRAKT